MKKQLLLTVGLCAGLIGSAVADSRVTIFYPGQAQATVITGLTTVGQLTTRPELEGRTWWPGTVIAERRATAVVVQQQQQLLARLTALSSELRQDNDTELAESVDRVKSQIAGMRVTGRQFTPLDPDWIRLHKEDNRTLSGEYGLYTLPRPTSVHVYGVITPSGSQPFQVSRDAHDYLQTHQRLSGAERSEAWVIMPDGKSQLAPVAYWNRRHVELAPGSTLFVGFRSWALPSAYRDVNEKIVSLLTHRIPD